MNHTDPLQTALAASMPIEDGTGWPNTVRAKAMRMMAQLHGAGYLEQFLTAVQEDGRTGGAILNAEPEMVLAELYEHERKLREADELNGLLAELREIKPTHKP